MNYDTMSVDALLAEYVHAQWIGFYAGVESEISIKAALRKAVIREASVGNVSIRLRLSAADFDHLVVTHEEKPHEWNDYDIVPKEII